MTDLSTQGANAAPFNAMAVERSPGPAWSSASFGVVGLGVTVFLPWGGLLSVLAVVLGFIARPGFPETRAVRLTGIITGVLGIIVALVWAAVVLVVASALPGDNF